MQAAQAVPIVSFSQRGVPVGSSATPSTTSHLRWATVCVDCYCDMGIFYAD